MWMKIVAALVTAVTAFETSGSILSRPDLSPSERVRTAVSQLSETQDQRNERLRREVRRSVDARNAMRGRAGARLAAPAPRLPLPLRLLRRLPLRR
jgi:hypothetical protein